MIDAKVENGKNTCCVDGDPRVLAAEMVQLENAVFEQVSKLGICELTIFEIVYHAIMQTIADAANVKAEARCEHDRNDNLRELIAEVNARFSSSNAKPGAKGQNIGTLAGCDEFICSQCGIHLEDWVRMELEDDGDYTEYEYVFNFCPNCGADIRTDND